MIFHIVTSRDGVGVVHENVKNVGSGTLVSAVLGGGAPNIQNLVGGGGQPLNAILTCAHVLPSDEDERIDAYFIPSDALNLDYGLPNDLDVATFGAMPAATQVDLIHFLRNSAQSFRIDTYTLWHRHPALLARPNNLMVSTKPQYLDNEDMVVATIIPNAGAGFRNYNGAANVNFIRGNGPVAAHVLGMNPYFAVGFPGCNQYDITPLVAFSQALTDPGVSPLFVTQGQVAMNVNNGVVEHSAPAAPGMSGGPLLTIDGGGHIHIFGVITSGIDNAEKACHPE